MYGALNILTYLYFSKDPLAKYMKCYHKTVVQTSMEVCVKMGFKARRRNIAVGRTSKAMILPALVESKEESTIAGNRLILSDPRGEIPEEALLEFFETYVEPNFWIWYTKWKAEAMSKGELNGQSKPRVKASPLSASAR